MTEHLSHELQSEKLLTTLPFSAYWLARLCGQTAQGALMYGLLILVADQTEKSIYGSLFVACSIVPSLLFGLIGGWVGDRLPQRLLLIGLSLLRASLVLFLVGQDVNIWTIFAVATGIWAIHQFFSPAETAMVARFVAPECMSTATSRANLALTLAQVLGMVILAPLMLKLDAPRVLFAIVAVLYAVPAILYIRMGRLRAPGSHHRTPPLALRTGWRTAAADRSTFGAMIDGMLISVGLSALVVIVPHYLSGVLHTSSSNTVFVFAPAVVGLIIGLQVAPLLGRLIGNGRLATIGLVGFAAAIVGLGLIDQTIHTLVRAGIDLGRVEDIVGVSPRVTATMLLSVPAGFFSALTNVAARTVVLNRTPDDARGQVIATQGTLSNLIALIPTFGAGLAIDYLDVRPVAVVVAALLVAGAILGRRIGGAERDDRPAPSALAVSPFDPAPAPQASGES